MSSIDRRSRASVIAGIGIIATLALGACSSSGTAASSEAGSVPGAAAPPSGKVGAGQTAGAAPGGAKDAKGGPAATPLQTQKLVRTATIRLSVDDVMAGAAGVRGVALGAGGAVTGEDISTTVPLPETTRSQPPPSDAAPSEGKPAGPAQPPGAATTTVARRSDYGIVTIAVPADKLDTVLDQLGKLGVLAQRTSSSQDVTGTYVDTQSRVATMKASIDRLRALMAQTTGIAQIVALETELSQREADLESLQATLATLDKQVTMSTVTVTLTSKTAPTTPAAGESGFLAGIRSGWAAFTGMFVALFTVVGTALPFAVTLALLALPGLIWWRRRAAGADRGVFAGFGPSSGDPHHVPAQTTPGEHELPPGKAQETPASEGSSRSGGGPSPATQQQVSQPGSESPSGEAPQQAPTSASESPAPRQEE